MKPIRFFSPDPLAEKYFPHSPFAYCANNPLIFIDPTGMDFSILIAPKGASGFGHMGAIIQDRNGAFYYIAAGTNENPNIFGIVSFSRYQENMTYNSSLMKNAIPNNNISQKQT